MTGVTKGGVVTDLFIFLLNLFEPLFRTKKKLFGPEFDTKMYDRQSHLRPLQIDHYLNTRLDNTTMLSSVH